MAHDVFISYGSPDKAVADAACARLEGRGFQCWIAPRDVRPGSQYGAELADALRSAKVVVLILSSHANYSKHVAREVEQAVKYGVPLIPLRIEDVEPSRELGYFIDSVHRLDALTRPLEPYLDQLGDSVQRLLQPLTLSDGPLRTPGATGTRVATASKPRSRAAIGIAAAVVLVMLGIWLTKSSANQTQSIVGCWRYPTGSVLRMLADGSVHGALLPGRWAARASDRYLITWPTFTDRVVLSDDGRKVTGVNNFGLPQRASRLDGSTTDRRSLAGAWTYNNIATVASEDGAIVAGPFHGKWRSTGSGAFVVEWTHQPVDDLGLSNGGNALTGSNNFGAVISATRATCSA